MVVSTNPKPVYLFIAFEIYSVTEFFVERNIVVNKIRDSKCVNFLV